MDAAARGFAVPCIGCRDTAATSLSSAMQACKITRVSQPVQENKGGFVYSRAGLEDKGDGVAHRHAAMK